MTAANLIDLARQTYPPQMVCRCGCVVRWVDGAGQTECPGGGRHTPRTLR